jgi:CRISPR-associated protein Cmr5
VTKPTKAEALLSSLQTTTDASTNTASPKGKTRAQRDLMRAADTLRPLQTASEGIKKNYLSRVKQFPALVMTVGLAQGVAFSVEKAGKKTDLGRAHRHLLNHVYGVLRPDAQGSPVDLETGNGRETVLNLIREADTLEYMHLTRRVLSAWVYYRRLAVSMLDPKDELQAKGEDER